MTAITMMMLALLAFCPRAALATKDSAVQTDSMPKMIMYDLTSRSVVAGMVVSFAHDLHSVQVSHSLRECDLR